MSNTIKEHMERLGLANSDKEAKEETMRLAVAIVDAMSEATALMIGGIKDGKVGTTQATECCLDFIWGVTKMLK